MQEAKKVSTTILETHAPPQAPVTLPRTQPMFNRPELETFRQVMTLLGASLVDQEGRGKELCALTFQFETSPEDEVRMHLRDSGEEYGGLGLDLWMYPEDVLRDASPQQMAAVIARWLRDTATKLEAAAEVRT